MRETLKIFQLKFFIGEKKSPTLVGPGFYLRPEKPDYMRWLGTWIGIPELM